MPHLRAKTRDEKLAFPHEIVALLDAARDPQPHLDSWRRVQPLDEDDRLRAESHYLLFSLMYLLGLRVGEAVSLRPEHLLPGSRAGLRFVAVPTLKQNARKDPAAPKAPVPLMDTPVLWGDAVVVYAFDPARCRGPWLFPAYTDPTRPLPPEVACREFKAIARRAGIRDCLSTHCLRHAAAAAVEFRSNEKTMHEFIRHTTKRSIDVYSHVPPERWAMLYGCLALPITSPDR